MAKKESGLVYNVTLFLTGIVMGAVNKIPGISGGTVAFIAGIYDKYIFAFRHIDGHAFSLLFSGKFRQMAEYVNLKFILVLFSGTISSFFTASLLLDWLIANYPVYIWSWFFGTIIGSLAYLVICFRDWRPLTIALMVSGACVTFAFSFFNYGAGSDNMLFILFCGAISVGGMALPGLSGSFILMLIGNYKLLLVDSVNAVFYALTASFRGDFSFIHNSEQIWLIKVCLIFTLGSIIGIIIFSHIFGWLLKKYHSQVVSLIIGFIFGSLAIMYPWKNPVYKLDGSGLIFLNKHDNPITIGYEHYLPDMFSAEFAIAILFIAFGIWLALFLERKGGQKHF